MKRVSTGGNKPPSEVGSIRSFRSVQTIEEQVDRLEEDLESLRKAQQDTNNKLDQILNMLATQGGNSKPTKSGVSSIGKKGE
jgi:chromosome segregation ATPase